MLAESYLPLLAVMFPLVAIVFRPFVEKHRYYHYTLIVSLVTLVIVIVMYPSIRAGNILNMSLDTGLGFNFVFRTDMLGFFVGILSVLLWTLSSLYAIEYMKGSHAHGRYNIFSLLSLGGMMGVVFTGNLFTLYIFFELLSVASAILVFHEETPEAMKAGFKYLFLGIAGGLVLLFGIIMTYEISGTGDLTMIGIGIQESKWVPFIFWSFIIGFGVKAGMFPMHIWLPSAHPVAPSPASALLSGVMIKAGAYGIFRTIYNILGHTDIVNNHMGLIFPLLILALITIFLGSACAITQTEIKKMLAYSSISQIGYVIMGITLLSPTGIVGGLLHIFAHAFMKATLFMCAGAFIHQTGLRELEDLKGIGKRMPLTTLCFSVCALSMIGLPPFIGFISKWFLAMGSLEAMRLGYYWPGIGFIALLTLLLSSLLNLVYYGPVVIGAWMHGAEGHAHESDTEETAESDSGKTDEANKIMLAPMLFLSLGVFFFGVSPKIPLDFVRKISKIFFP